VSLGFDRAGNGADNGQVQRPNVVPGAALSGAITWNPTAFVNPSFIHL
jgi:hypothetical protein